MANSYSIILKGKISPDSIKTEIKNLKNKYTIELNATISQTSLSNMRQQVENALSNIQVKVNPNVGTQTSPSGAVGVSSSGGGSPETQRLLNARLSETTQIYNDQEKQVREVNKYLTQNKDILVEKWNIEEDNQKKLSGYSITQKTALKQEQAVLTSNTKKYNDFKLLLGGLKDAGKISAQSFQHLNEQLEGFQTKLGDSSSKVGFKLFGEDVNLAKSNMTMYTNIGERIKRLGEEGIVSQQSIRKFNSELKTINTSTDEVGKAKGFQQLNQQISDSKKQVMSFGQMLGIAYKKFAIWSIATVSWYSMVRMIRNVVKEVISLDKAFTSLQIVTKNTNAQMDKLKATYVKMATDLGASLQTVAEGSDTWLRAGLTASETNKALTASTTLSIIANEQAVTATEHLISVMKAYHLEASELIGIVDKLSEVDVVSASSSEEIGEALTLSANSARLAGVELDKYIGIIATVKEVTQQSASSIGNSFKTIFARLTAVKLGSLVDEEGQDISNAMSVLKQYGIELMDLVTGDFKDMGVVLNELGEKWGSLNKAQRSEIATTIAGIRQREKFLALMENYDRALELEKVSMESAGAAMEKYNIYTNSVEASLNRMKTAFSEMSMKTLKSKDIKWVSDLATGLMGAISATGGLVKTITLLIGVMLTLKNLNEVLSFKHVIQGAKNFSVALKTLEASGKAASTAFGYIGLAITAITSAFMIVSAIQNKTAEIRENLISISEENITNLDDMKRRYSELYNMQSKTVEQQNEMIALQERIASSFAKTTGKVMETTAAYKDNIQAIKDMTEAEINKILALRKPDYDKAIKELSKNYLTSQIESFSFDIINSEDYQKGLLKQLAQMDNAFQLTTRGLAIEGNYLEVEKTFNDWFDLYGSSLGVISEYDTKINEKMTKLYSKFSDKYADYISTIEEYEYYLELLEKQAQDTGSAIGAFVDTMAEYDALVATSKNVALRYNTELDKYVKRLNEQNEALEGSIALSEKYLAIRQAMLAVEEAQASVSKARTMLSSPDSFYSSLLEKDGYSSAKEKLGIGIFSQLTNARKEYDKAISLMSEGKISKEEVSQAYENYEKIRQSINSSYGVMEDYLTALENENDLLNKQNEELELKESYNKSILNIAEKQYDVNNAMAKLQNIDQFYDVNQAKRTYDIAKIAKEYPIEELNHYIESLEYQNDKIKEHNDLLERNKRLTEALTDVQEAQMELNKAYLKLQNESEFYNVDKARERYDIAQKLYELPIEDLEHLIESLEYQNSILDRQNEITQKELDIQEKLYDVEKAREELAKAKQSRIRIYREGQGFVYEEDVFAISDANDNLSDANKNLKDSQDSLQEYYEDRELDNLRNYLEILKGVKNSQDALTETEEALTDAQQALNDYYSQYELNKLKQYSELIKGVQSAQENLTSAEKDATKAKNELSKFYENSKREEMELYAIRVKELIVAEEGLSSATMNLVNANKELDKLEYQQYLDKVNNFITTYKGYLDGDLSMAEWTAKQGSYGSLLDTEFGGYLSKARQFIIDYNNILKGITVQPDINSMYSDELWEALLDAQTTSLGASTVMSEWAHYNEWLSGGGLSSGNAYSSLHSMTGSSTSSGTQIDITNLNLPNVKNAQEFVDDIIDMFGITVQQGSSQR